ncbi:MAG TPA: cysteine--tRNA ligase [Candidatus Acidoferrales bacterium]|nr:cysteine--tRNA ligase [Candidatus Acidoferrales bacterium]
MNEIQFQNTLTGRKEPFEPLQPGEVRMYTCGPTVYDFAHIGNFRTFVFQDLLRRFLRSRGFRVKQVMNLTDVDDRIIQNATAAGIGIREYTDRYIQAFLEDMRVLNLEAPETLARATDHIDDMVALIEILIERGFAYKSDGSIYFRIARFPRYGRLAKVDFSGIQAGARVDVDRYEKDDARDFALWKAHKPGEYYWETRIGPGRPGWHIECSTMAMKFLGPTLDLHTGGVDLVFPHHENEIAQSEAATDQPFVRTWLHAEHLFVNGEKMSKSLGNFYTLRDLFARGYRPSAVRFLLASVPYRRQLNFTWDGLTQAASSVDRLRNFVARLKSERLPAAGGSFAARIDQAEQGFEAGLADDLNTAQALAAIFNLVRDVNIAIDRGEFPAGDAPRALAAIERFDAIFAVVTDDDARKLRELGYPGEAEPPADADIEALVGQRNDARRQRDFQAADRIREELAVRGIILEDLKDGTVRWKRK